MGSSGTGSRMIRYALCQVRHTCWRHQDIIERIFTTGPCVQAVDRFQLALGFLAFLAGTGF
jgi:hypothetical protein